MKRSGVWMSASEAVGLVRSGQRVFIHGSAATPVTLLRALFQRAGELKNVELVSISTLGDIGADVPVAVSYTHLRAHETVLDLVCRLLLEKKKLTIISH